MDYNIEPGIGTELDADSVGAGLLAHERAYLAWLDSVFKKYPDLVIENCSSGGLRIDYALLSRYSIQSTSDQEDYQCTSWSDTGAGGGMVLSAEKWRQRRNHFQHGQCHASAYPPERPSGGAFSGESGTGEGRNFLLQGNPQ